jgi:hypothetical protein
MLYSHMRCFIGRLRVPLNVSRTMLFLLLKNAKNWHPTNEVSLDVEIPLSIFFIWVIANTMVLKVLAVNGGSYLMFLLD